MKTIFVLAALFGVMFMAVDAKAANTSWTLVVNDGFISTSYNAGNGGSVRLGLETCEVSHPYLLKTDTTTYETVTVSCEHGIGEKIMVSTACNANGGSSGVGILQIKTVISNYTLTLFCRN